MRATLHFRGESLIVAAALALVACGGGNASTSPENPSTSGAGAPTPASNGAKAARPTCDAIDEACDPHEDEGGLAKQCHDLAEAAATPEATCLAKKAECLAACPPKAKTAH